MNFIKQAVKAFFWIESKISEKYPSFKRFGIPIFAMLAISFIFFVGWIWANNSSNSIRIGEGAVVATILPENTEVAKDAVVLDAIPELKKGDSLAIGQGAYADDSAIAIGRGATAGSKQNE
jgi:hypothetical protein